MNTIIIPSTQKKDPDKERILSEGVQESIYPDHQEENITEGSEYMDDAIRMKDQPFEETTGNENE